MHTDDTVSAFRLDLGATSKFSWQQSVQSVIIFVHVFWTVEQTNFRKVE